MQQIVINGDNLEVLKKYPDNYFDAVVTDPPYGLGKEPDAVELMKDWVDHGYHEIKGAGFMGKEWDAFVPQPLFWKEVFRVLKHGGHVVSFFGTRTYDWGVMAMRFAGFEVRDCIQWLYGCLSDDTEILTRSGYIQYHKFIKLPNFEQQEICVYDAENDIYKWEKPERWNEYNINKDTCYRIKSDSTDQIVSRNHRCLVEREGKLVFIQAKYLSEMERMPTLSHDFFVLQESKVLQSSMQWTLSGSGMEEMGKDRFRNIKFEPALEGKQRREESIVERGNNLSEKERVLFGSKTEICEMPERVYSDGKEGWLCGGVSFSDGKTVGQTPVENGMRTSYRPQPNEQRYNESNAIFNEQGTQAVRMGRSYSTTLATIKPIEYSGLIFCPTVSTGAFVARRNGKLFLTGNSGFPKSYNVAKGIEGKIVNGSSSWNDWKNLDGEKEQVNWGYSKGQAEQGYRADYTEANKERVGKVNFQSEEAKQWDGWGSALKPANEPIVLARKPLEKGLSIAENVLKWGTGGINIDGCRVGSDNRTYKGMSANQPQGAATFRDDNWKPKDIEVSVNGRFPANIILSHSALCQHKGTKKVKSVSNYKSKDGYENQSVVFNGQLNSMKSDGYADENGQETIEDWNCHPDCPIKIMDEQSGISKSPKETKVKNSNNPQTKNTYGDYSDKDRVINGHNDIGGASRFFYCAKASKSERNKGLEGFEEKKGSTNHNSSGRDIGRKQFCQICDKRQGACKCEQPNFSNENPNKRANFHPTVKPVKLMQYLARLITPPNGKVLDPFCGSGTTGVACKLEGFEFVGIEQDPEYTKIAEARITNWKEEKEENKPEIKKNEPPPLTQTTLF